MSLPLVLQSLSVIQGTKIVRCDACKSYINPFVTFLDNTRWRCSICFRVNDRQCPQTFFFHPHSRVSFIAVPQEFLFDPVTKSYGDPSRRPEVRYGTVEYTATADYMARPPQPAMYLFLLDVSHNAIHTGKRVSSVIDLDRVSLQVTSSRSVIFSWKV